MPDVIELVAAAIRDALTEVETTIGGRVTEAYAGISGEFVRCARHTDHVFTYDPENGVNRNDVDALFERMRNVQAPDDEIIMERIPQNYVVDDDQEVRNPVGSFCKKLSSTFNFILCAKTPLQRLEMALKRLGIRTAGIFPNVLTVPESLLLPEEKEEGVAVVDLGGGLTNVTVYYRGVARYVATIPMGAGAINRDIRSQSIPEKYVESLKCKYGSAVADLAPEDKMIRVNGRTAREAKDILLRNLATVIEARATDIAEFVQQEIKESGYADKLAYGIVLTGGSAQLKDIDELFRRVTGLEVRAAAPEIGLTDTAREVADNPTYAAAVGILLKAVNPVTAASAFIPPQPVTSPTSRPTAKPGAPAQTYVPPKEKPFTPPTQASTPASAFARPTSTPTPAPQPSRPTPQPIVEEEDERVERFEESIEEPVMKAPTTRDPFVDDEDGADDDPMPVKKRGEKNWGAIFKRAMKNINESFNAVDDEEI